MHAALGRVCREGDERRFGHRPSGRAVGTPLYLYDFDVIERQVRAPQTRPRPALRAGLRRQGKPVARRPVSFFEQVRSRGGRRIAGRAARGAARRIPAFEDSLDRPREDRRRPRSARARAGFADPRRRGMGARKTRGDRGSALGARVRVGLRLNPPWGIAEKKVIIGGPGAKKFGFDLGVRRESSSNGRDRGASRISTSAGSRSSTPRTSSTRAFSSRTRAAFSLSLFHFRRNTRFRCAPSTSEAASACPMRTARRPLDLGDSRKGA